MSRADKRLKRATKRKIKQAEERALIESINAVARPMNCHVTGLGPHAVGVQGDARTYGIAVVLRFPPDATAFQISETSTLITNRVKQVTRVLMDIPLT